MKSLLILVRTMPSALIALNLKLAMASVDVRKLLLAKVMVLLKILRIQAPAFVTLQMVTVAKHLITA